MVQANNAEAKARVSKRRWAAYAAAGVAVAASGSTADAALTRVIVGETLDGFNQDPTDDTYAGNLSGIGGTIEFTNADFGVGDASVGLNGVNTGDIAGYTFEGFRYIQKLQEGVFISQLTEFVDVNGQVARLAYGNIGGQFREPSQGDDGLFGFRFDIGNGLQFGWGRVTMQGAEENVFTVEEYVYGDVGDQVQAGRFTAVPEPGSLGVLALGAAGIAAMRRRRAARQG